MNASSDRRLAAARFPFKRAAVWRRASALAVCVSIGFSCGVSHAGPEQAPADAATTSHANSTRPTPASHATRAATAAPTADDLTHPNEHSEAVLVGLFKQALLLMQARRHLEASGLLEQVLILDDGMGARYKLAECYAKLDRSASAYKQYQRVVAMAEKARRDALIIRDEDRAALMERRLGVTKARLRHLKTRLTKIVLLLPIHSVGMPPLHVKLTRLGDEDDEQPLVRFIADKDMGQLIPVDPGRYRLSVFSRGYASYTTEMEAREPGLRLSVTLPQLAPQKFGPLREPVEVPQPLAQPDRGMSPAKTVGISLLAVGGLAGAVGGVIAIWGSTEEFERDYTAIGTGIVGLGGLAMATGATLMLLPDPEPEPTSTHQRGPAKPSRGTIDLGLGPAGLRLSGTF